MKRFLYIIIAVILFAGLFWLLSQPPKDENVNKEEIINDIYKDFTVYDNPDLVFYWGNGCPHCKNVENWLDENNSDKKLKVNYKQVYQNINNQNELYNMAKQYCPDIINNGGIGVPVGFDPVNKKCIIGDTPIIEFLSDKLTK